MKETPRSKRRELVIAALVTAALVLIRVATLAPAEPRGPAEMPNGEEMRIAAAFPAGAPPCSESTVALPPPEPADAPTRRVVEAIPLSLAGRIVLPRGTPRDETIEVIVQTRPPADACGWQVSELYGLLRAAGRAPVDAGGGFRFHLPEGTEPGCARLRFTSRYVNLPESWIVEDFDDPIVIHPPLGGAIRYSLLPDADSHLDPQSIVGHEVMLSWIPAGYRTWRGPPEMRRLTVDAELVVFAGGLDAECEYDMFFGDLPPFAPMWPRDVRVRPGEVTTVEVPLHDGLAVAGRIADSE